MIKSIQLKNFQSHKDSFIELHEGINMFKGHSRAGKTAFYRAILYVLRNKPSGLGLVSSWAKENNKSGKEVIQDASFVEIAFDNGTIKRQRDKKENFYEIDGVKLKAMKTSVPQEITKLANLDEVNFGGQHDLPFLLRSGGGGGAEAARFLNSLVDFTESDKALTLSENKKRASKSEVDRIETNLKETKISLTKYNKLDEAQDTLEDAQELEEKSKALESTNNELEKLILLIEKADLDLEKHKDLSVLESKIEEFEKASKELENLKSINATIERHCDNLELANRTLSKAVDIEKINSLISEFENLEMVLMAAKTNFGKLKTTMDNIEQANIVLGSMGKLDEVEDLICDFDALVLSEFECKRKQRQIKEQVILIDSYDKTIEKCEKDILDCEKELDSLGVVCPKCHGSGVVQK